jgi:carbonic anhydrase
VHNVANIVPPYEKDAAHHGTSAALEFGDCFLKVLTLYTC